MSSASILENNFDETIDDAEEIIPKEKTKYR